MCEGRVARRRTLTRHVFQSGSLRHPESGGGRVGFPRSVARLRSRRPDAETLESRCARRRGRARADEGQVGGYAARVPFEVLEHRPQLPSCARHGVRCGKACGRRHHGCALVGSSLLRRGRLRTVVWGRLCVRWSRGERAGAGGQLAAGQSTECGVAITPDACSRRPAPSSTGRSGTTGGVGSRYARRVGRQIAAPRCGWPGLEGSRVARR